MKPAVARTPTLAETLWPAQAEAGYRAFRLGLLALVGSLLIAVSAQFQVPMYPVPMTMQSFAVLAIGMAYGAKLGFATVLLYIAEGALGLPVFAGMKGGAPHLLGPTGGYLAGFALAALLVGWLAERGWDRGLLRTFTAMMAGKAVIFLLGVGWLASLIGLEKAVALGFVPFIPGIILKVALAMAVLPGAWKLVGRRAG
jgi:biotin transport system substrate-specific component